MTTQSTMDKLIEMRLTAMSDAFRTQISDCNLRRTAATGAFASGHPAEPNGHLH